MESLRSRRGVEFFRIFEVACIIGFLLVSGLLVLLNPTSSTPRTAQSGESENIEAVASAMPNQGWVPLTVYFSAFGSRAAAGDLIIIEWDLDSNGSFETDATSENGYVNYTYAKPGEYVVRLRVTDENGQVATDSILIDARHPGSSSVDYWTIFDDSKMRRVVFTLTQDEWDRMWVDPPAKIEVNASANIFGERLEEVGLRMRGQFSLRESGEKKPWKINTDAFIEGQEYHNLKQLMFINNIGDPSMLQEKLAYDLMQFAGVPSSHVCFVDLWIDFSDDDEPAIFWGVYTMVERVDMKFLANRFGPAVKEGNLYKASHAQRGPMDLAYYGDRLEDYPTQNGLYSFGKATNEEEADYTDILNLIYVIDGVQYDTPGDFATALEEVFNVDAFLRYMAAVVMLGNWDSYPYTGNNYYLFNNAGTGKFEWIPWDLTWGGDPRQPLFELEGPRISPRAPLYDKVFEIERYRMKFSAYLDLLARHWFNYPKVSAMVEKYHNMIAPYVTQGSGDKMYFGDTAHFPVEAFYHSLEGLGSYAGERSDFVLETLEQEE
jgi:hypothetical protein